MKLKDRIKTYNFWVSLSSAIFLFLKVLGSQLGFEVDENLFSDLITSLCGILVILGIIVPPSYKSNESLLTPSNNLTQSSDNSNSNSCTEEENVSNSTLDGATGDLENEPYDVAFNNENASLLETENNLEQKESIQTSSEDSASTNANIEELKSQVAKTLLNQEKLFEGHSSLYIELLQTQIDNMQNK